LRYGGYFNAFLFTRDVNPQQLSLQYKCDAAVRGESGVIASAQLCPTGTPAPIQGFSVDLVGPLHEFYSLAVECKTKGAGPQRERVAGKGEWCGLHAGAGQLFVWTVNVSAKRRESLLVSTLDAKLHTRELRFSKGLLAAEALQDELQNFQSHVSQTGEMLFEHRSGKHDDLIFSIAMPLWWTIRCRKYRLRTYGVRGLY